MEIYPDQNCPEMEPITLNGISIPNESNYIYLGLEINKELNFDEMAKFRTKCGKETAAMLNNTLYNTRVPLEYRRMVINNLLIPKLCFGGKFLGMSELRMVP